jgi:O-antigen ligase
MIKDLFSTLLSFEFVFVLYLFAGRYKNDPIFNWVPVDITLLFLLLSILVGFWVLYKRRFFFRRKSLILSGLFIAFVSYAISSYFWTPSTVYATKKIGYLSVLTLWPFLACTIIIGYDVSRFRRFVFSLAGLSVWFVIESLAAFFASTSPGQQVAALGVSYLGLGRVIGPAAMVFIVYGTILGRNRISRVFALIVYGGYVVTLLLIGGRGPFLATVLPVLFLLYYGVNVQVFHGIIRVRKYIAPLLLFGIAGLGAAVSFGSTEIFSTIKRLALLFDTLGGSASIRLEMYGEAIDIWGQHPLFGAGIGGWPVLAGWGDQRMYPHNMILEVLSEFGILGFFLWSLPFIYALWVFSKMANNRSNPWAVLALMLLANSFIVSMVTGDITDNRVVFAFLGLLVSYDFTSVRNEKNKV